jgi:hypothetical protein
MPEQFCKPVATIQSGQTWSFDENLPIEGTLIAQNLS